MVGRGLREWTRAIGDTLWLVHPKTGEIQAITTLDFMNLSIDDERISWIVALDEVAAALRATGVQQHPAN